MGMTFSVRWFDYNVSFFRPSATRPVIPKRGEKEFEPRAQGVTSQDEPAATSTGTALQQHILNRAREAMFSALRAPRTTSTLVSISEGVFFTWLMSR